MTTKGTVKVTQKIIHNRARCRLCGDTIESMHRHDFVTCKCGEISVDGGHAYFRRLARDFKNLEELSEFVETTEKP